MHWLIWGRIERRTRTDNLRVKIMLVANFKDLIMLENVAL